MPEIDLEVQFRGVAFRRQQGRQVGVDCNDLAGGPFMLDRQRHRPRTRAQVEHAIRVPLQREIHQQLGLGTRDQHRGIHRQSRP
jgi:hypothetical protein